ncbi:MAG: large conductance mechanosensitive channel protein MscL, partial [Oscillospiraceae bacterium]|nr:large conductance mechanosensitive channel protein MscL [Oscillospiraceae bacterium]
MVQEFKEFIMRGNVLDMAVGVIIATAFGKITTSLVNDVFMPFISWIFGTRDMTALNVVVCECQRIFEPCAHQHLSH